MLIHRLYQLLYTTLQICNATDYITIPVRNDLYGTYRIAEAKEI